MSAVAIIPARGGSTRIPRKNIKLFHGRPIIAYSILTAIESCLFDAIFVSTDDDEIAAVAEEYGAVALHRDRKHSQNNVGTQEVMAYALPQVMAYNALSHSRECCPYFACCIYPCAPLMMAHDLEDGWQGMSVPTVDYVYSVSRSGAADIGNWYWGKTVAFLARRPLDPRAGRTSIVPIPDERAIDINTPDDWTRAEEMYKLINA